MAVVPRRIDTDVRLAPISGEKLRPVRVGQGLEAIGEGMKGFGRALSDYADEQDKADAALDSAGARTLDADAMTRINTIRQEYKAQRGMNAGTAKPDTEKALADLREEIMGKATTPRMKGLLGTVLDQRIAGANEDIADHYRVQIAAAEDTASVARQTALMDTAILATNEDERAKNIGAAMTEIASRGQRLGLGADAIAVDQRKFVSGVRTSVIRDLIDGDDVNGALAYRQANLADFTAEDDERLDKMLRDPLEARQADTDLTAALAAIRGEGAAPGQGTAIPEVAGTRQDAIRTAANELGIAPSELAAIASYEGRLNPKTVGGAGGGYEGLFQFGAEERRKYGIDRNSSFEEQTAALVRFAKDRGFRPGMGWKKLYTTINGGNPNVSVNARDANGSQLDHYKAIEGTHFAIGQAFVGGAATGGEAHDGEDLAKLDDYLRGQVAAGTMSPERADRVRDRATKQVSFQNTIRAQNEADAVRDAYDVIDKLPGNTLTSMEQIPADIRGRLSSADRIKLEEEVKRNTAPKPVEANGSVVAVFNRMAAENPEAFVGTDLRTIRGQVTPAEWDTLFTLQGRLKGNPRGDAWVAQSSLMTMVRSNAPYIGLDLTTSGGKFNNEDDSKAAQVIVSMMQADLQGVTGGKRAPTQAEIEGAFDRATMKGRIVSPGLLWGENEEETFRFRAYGEGGRGALKPGQRFEFSVPAAARAKIIQSLRTATGNPRYNPSNQEIGEIYKRYSGTPGYGY